jgi:hypothetical protein
MFTLDHTAIISRAFRNNPGLKNPRVSFHPAACLQLTEIDCVDLYNGDVNPPHLRSLPIAYHSGVLADFVSTRSSSGSVN